MSKDINERFDAEFVLEDTWTGKKQFQVIISAYTKDIKAFFRKELADQKDRAIEIAKTIHFPNSGETVATVLEEKL